MSLKHFEWKSCPSNKPCNPEQDKQRIIFFLPYLGQFSFKLRNNIIKRIQDHYPNFKLQFVFKSPKCFSSLFKNKDIFPPLLCSNVIYKYSCSGCSVTYYGKTCRNLKIRCNEHLGIIKSGGNHTAPSWSSIWDHINKQVMLAPQVTCP